MTDLEKRLLNRINKVTAFDETLTELKKVNIKNEASFDILTNIIKKDPILMANVIKYANAPAYGLTKEITNIRQIVALFGLVTLKNFIITAMVRNIMKIDVTLYNMDNNKFLEMIDLQNRLVSEWYGKIKPEALDLVGAISYLMELGKVVISTEINTDYRFIKSNPQIKEDMNQVTSEGELLIVERKHFGLNNIYIAYELLKHWKFSNEILDIVKNLYTPKKLENKEFLEYIIVLRIVKNVINIKEMFRDNDIEQSANIIEKKALNKELFLSVVESLKERS